jgi:hypothetical protein
MNSKLLSLPLVCLLGTAIGTFSQAASAASVVKPGAKKPAAASSQVSTKAKPAKVRKARPVSNDSTQPSAKPAVTTAETAPEVPVADAELGSMFRGKTWVWPEGAAYFAPNGKFIAWSGKNTAASFARGSWRTAPKGRLCFSAQWVSRAGAGPAETCFSHVVKSGDLFQRKDPKGEWYVFKHATPLADDEFSKLVAGDQAGAEAEKIRATFRRG